MDTSMSKYIKEGHFDIAALINDDFLLAIKLLWNQKQYSSTLKLLLCFVDTMAYVSTGNSSPGSFMGWLKKYVDLKKIGITENEVWEHRNSVLHLSTYESTKVKDGKVRKIVPYAGQLPPKDHEYAYYSLYELQMEIFIGVGRYLEEMIDHPKMVQIFSENYEKTISDMHFR